MNNPDIPEIPPEVLARKPMALTPQTAALIGGTEYMDDSGRAAGRAIPSNPKRFEAARIARQRAEAYAGPAPLAGLSPEQIDAIRGKSYPDLPKMDLAVGDRTEAFVNALWAKYPWDAAKRFGGSRQIWPTELPKNWPPVRPERDAIAPGLLGVALAESTNAPRVYTQAEVDAMLAAAKKPAPKKRIRNRSKKPAPQPAVVNVEV